MNDVACAGVVFHLAGRLVLKLVSGRRMKNSPSVDTLSSKIENKAVVAFRKNLVSVISGFQIF